MVYEISRIHGRAAWIVIIWLSFDNIGDLDLKTPNVPLQYKDI